MSTVPQDIVEQKRQEELRRQRELALAELKKQVPGNVGSSPGPEFRAENEKGERIESFLNKLPEKENLLSYAAKKHVENTGKLIKDSAGLASTALTYGQFMPGETAISDQPPRYELPENYIEQKEKERNELKKDIEQQGEKLESKGKTAHMVKFERENPKLAKIGDVAGSVPSEVARIAPYFTPVGRPLIAMNAVNRGLEESKGKSVPDKIVSVGKKLGKEALTLGAFKAASRVSSLSPISESFAQKAAGLGKKTAAFSTVATARQQAEKLEAGEPITVEGVIEDFATNLPASSLYAIPSWLARGKRGLPTDTPELKLTREAKARGEAREKLRAEGKLPYEGVKGTITTDWDINQIKQEGWIPTDRYNKGNQQWIKRNPAGGIEGAIFTKARVEPEFSFKGDVKPGVVEKTTEPTLDYKTPETKSLGAGGTDIKQSTVPLKGLPNKLSIKDAGGNKEIIDVKPREKFNVTPMQTPEGKIKWQLHDGIARDISKNTAQDLANRYGVGTLDVETPEVGEVIGGGKIGAGEITKGVPGFPEWSKSSQTFLKKAQEKPEQVQSGPRLRLIDDVTVKDIHGNKTTFKKGHDLSTRIMGGQVLAQDGNDAAMPKNQFEALKGKAVELGEKSALNLPEGLEVVSKGGMDIARYKEAVNKALNEWQSIQEQNIQAYGRNRQSWPQEQTDAWQIAKDKYHNIVREHDTSIDEDISQTKFAQHINNKGDNYKETLVKVPQKKTTFWSIQTDDGQLQGTARGTIEDAEKELSRLQSHPNEKVRIAAKDAKIIKMSDEDLVTDFKSSHWDEPNVIAHLLTSEYQTTKGEKVHNINETQSDWEKAGRLHGYRGQLDTSRLRFENIGKREDGLNLWNVFDGERKLPGQFAGETKQDIIENVKKYNDGISTVPYNPNLKNWLDISLTQALKDAVDSGAKYLSWDDGQTVKDRYDLSKQVDYLSYQKTGDGKYLVSAFRNGEGIPLGELTPEKLPSAVGKAVADKIINNEGKKVNIAANNEPSDIWTELSGVDLKVGGEWADHLYNRMIPKRVLDLTKKLGGRLVEIKIANPLKGASSFNSFEKWMEEQELPFALDEWKEDGPNLKRYMKEVVKDYDIKQAILLTPEIIQAVQGGLQPMAGGITRGKLTLEGLVKGSSKVPSGMTRLYRVEPKDLGNKGEWLKNSLTQEQYKEFLSRRGRLFSDNIESLKNYGWGSGDFNHFYVDVPNEVAQKIASKHPDGFMEYLLPDEYLAQKKEIAQEQPAVGEQSLLEEARKYKTAEEFVGAQEKPSDKLYREAKEYQSSEQDATTAGQLNYRRKKATVLLLEAIEAYKKEINDPNLSNDNAIRAMADNEKTDKLTDIWNKAHGVGGGKDFKDLKLFHGSKGKVSEETKSFQNVWENDNQNNLLKELAKDGVKEAGFLVGKYKPNNWVLSDRLIARIAKSRGYDAVMYSNSDRPQLGYEIHDVNEGKFYAEKKELAELYAKQKRDLKHKSVGAAGKDLPTDNIPLEGFPEKLQVKNVDGESVNVTTTPNEKISIDLVQNPDGTVEYELHDGKTVTIPASTALKLAKQYGKNKIVATASTVSDQLVSDIMVDGKKVPRPSFRVDKINAPEDVINLMKQVAEKEGEFKSQRPTGSLKELQRLAKEAKITVDDLLDLPPGSIVSSPELIKANQIRIALAKDLSDYSKKIDTSVATPEELKIFKEKTLRFTAVMKTLAGMRTEASNIFRSFQIVNTPQDETALRELLGDIKRIDKDAAGDLEQFAKNTRKAMEPTTADKIWHLWYASILSGPLTHIKNITSNVVQLGLELGRISLTSPTEVPSAIFGLLSNMSQASKDSFEAFTKGKISKLEDQKKLPVRFTGRFTRLLNVSNYVGNALEGVDTFFKTLTYGMDMRQIAFVEGKSKGLKGKKLHQFINERVQNPTEEMQAAAKEYMLYMTYQQRPNGILGVLAEALGKAARKQPALRPIVPFTRVVANVANNAIDWTPWGFARWGFEKVRDVKGQEGRWAKDKRGRGKMLGRALVGTLAMTAFAYLAAQEKLTGRGPSDPKKRKQMMDAGWRPHSFVFTDKDGNKTFVPYTYILGPAALTAAIPANFFDAIRHGDINENDALDRASIAILGSMRLILDMSFLNGISDTLSAIENYDLFGPSYLKRMMSQPTAPLVPNLIKQIDRYFDPTVYNTDKLKDYLLNSMRITSGLKPQINLLGDAVVGDKLTQFTSSDLSKDPVKRFLFNNNLFISVPNKNSKLYDIKKDEMREMTDDEMYNFIGLSGLEIRKRLEDENTMMELLDVKKIEDALQPGSGQEAMQDELNKIVRSARSDIKFDMEDNLAPKFIPRKR